MQLINDFEKLTGLKTMIVGNNMPTRCLVPKENIKPSI